MRTAPVRPPRWSKSLREPELGQALTKLSLETLVMKVQRVVIPDRGDFTWLLLDDEFLPVKPVCSFLAYLDNLERSPHTIRAYAQHLKQFWEYLRDAHVEWTAVELSHLSEFVARLRRPLEASAATEAAPSARRSETTVNAMLAAVTSFYEFQARLGEVRGLPLFRPMNGRYRPYKGFLHHINRGQVSVNVLKLRAPKHAPPTLTAEQVQQLIAACDRRRDRLLLCLLYETGIRIGQALGLRHADIRSYDQEIQIIARANANGARAKSKDPYVIHVSGSLMGLYADYLIHEYGEIESDYVFVNCWGGERGRPMRYAAVADLFRRLSQKTGIAVHPHLFRHTHATELIRAGWDAAYVQRRLGHAQVQTTINTYVHLTGEDLKAAYDAYAQQGDTAGKEASS
jgi:integrase/recombinase XerD